MKKTVVLNVVGLTERCIGKYTPFLSEWVAAKEKRYIEPVLPAVTCSAQACYLTGKWPEEHGIVGNGWYCREEGEIKFWKQSNHLVKAEKIWDVLKKENPDFTCANLFWWYNMYSSADYTVTPRPMYPADGRKIPDIYTRPSELREYLQHELGRFPLFRFWGPTAAIASTQWIAAAARLTDIKFNPTLTLVYLPHLDYCFQRWGINEPLTINDLAEIDAVCRELIHYYEEAGTEVIVLSEYGITDVTKPVYINRLLRKNGFLHIREELGRELLDAGASKAFAVCDHQVAHVYLDKHERMDEIKELLENTEGIELVLSGNEKKAFHLDHERAGDMIAVAAKDAWFSYYYWLNDKHAPDFARTVDIHRKPGYDPAELFLDPKIRFKKAKIAGKLLKRKLGFRVLMDVIPLEAELVKGSHGRIPESKQDWPLIIASRLRSTTEAIKAIDVFEEIKGQVIGEQVR